MKHEQTNLLTDEGARLVWHAVGDADRGPGTTPASVSAPPQADPAAADAVEGLRHVDRAMRALAASEAPDAAAMDRSRAAVMRTVGAQGVEWVRRGALRTPAHPRRLPRWALPTAAAAVLLVGFVAWLGTTSPPVSMPAEASPLALAAEEMNRREEYRAIVVAFNPFEVNPEDPLDEADSQADVLARLSELSQE